MSIKSTEYVFITSGVVGVSVAQQELIGRRFTTDPRVPVGSILRVSSGEADTFFGSASDESVFAREYFSVVLPAPISRPSYLQFAAYAPAGRAPSVFGSPIKATLQDFINATGGTLKLQLGDLQVTTGAIDLSAVASFADVASAVQEEIQAMTGTQYAGVTVTYNSIAASFEMVGDTTAPALAEASVGSIATLMGLVGLGAINSAGVAPQSPIEAFQLAEQVSDSFGSASFGDAVTLSDALPLAQYVDGENVKYMMLWPVTEFNYASWSAAMVNIASNGLVLNRTAGEYKESIPMAIQAASDYDVRMGGRVNYMFRQSGITADVTETQEARTLNASRINYYGRTAVFGQKLDFFQRGYLMGNLTAPLDMGVHSGEQWLKSYCTSKFFALFMGVRSVPNNNDGRGMILAVLDDAIRQAFFNGVLSVGKDLTVTQRETIAQMTGDQLAYITIENTGWWADVLMAEEVVNGVTEYIAKYTLIYSKNDSVRKIQGQHSLV